jgi:hypothetical protein
MNIVLLYRVLIGDYFNGKKSTTTNGCSNGSVIKSTPELAKMDRMNGHGVKNGFHSIDSLVSTL